MRRLAWPVRRNADGTPATVEADSDTEIAQSLELLLATPRGDRAAVPDYGIPDPVGLRTADLALIGEAIGRFEPRVDIDIVLQRLDPDDPSRRDMTVTWSEG